MNSFDSRAVLTSGSKSCTYFRLPALTARGFNLDRLPFSLKILLENLLRREDGVNVTAGDIEFLAQRLQAATEWVVDDPALAPLRIGYFGSSTGAAAALIAAATEPDLIGAVVSRGGRPDLAMRVLDRIRSPTLFIVGGDDAGVIELNEEAFRALHCEKRFDIIPRATHLFEEPGALEQVAEIAGEWFENHLAAAAIGARERPGRHPPPR